MPAKSLDTLDVRSRQLWRNWLQEHHTSRSEIWVIFYKRHTSVSSISYDDAVEEALCFGWVDSLVKRLDDDRYAQKFTPRKPDSKWSTSNRTRYADLEARGLLAPAGRERPPTNRSGDAPRPSISELPSYIEKALKADMRVWNAFQQLAPSYRRNCIVWIDSATRAETKEKRLREVIDLTAAGKKLELK
jgi:uncharacterized protein YdeI (YjbR/CyaY-like superfamily)